jgi:5-methylcytosine-specific restriction endonuclease McrA
MSSKAQRKAKYIIKSQIDTHGHNFCEYCFKVVRHYPHILGKPMKKDTLTIDHAIPTSKGGGWELDNLRVCCWQCNNKKGDKV